MDIPPDLLQCQRDFFRLDAQCNDLADRLPAARDLINGLAEPDLALNAELAEARANRLEAVMRIHRHPWWGTIPAEGQAGARNTLREAAREALAINA